MKQVVAPHIDDALLSLGGAILNWVGKKEKVKIFYVFIGGYWVNPKPLSGKTYPKDAESITNLRKKEEANAQKIAKAETVFLDFPDSKLRLPKPGLFEKLAGYLLHPFSEKPWESIDGLRGLDESKLVERMVEELKARLDKSEACFFPLAMSKWNHPDHVLVREAGIRLLGQGYNVLFYEDLPYLVQGKSKQLESFLSRLKLKPVLEETEMNKKIALLECYQSQVSREWLEQIKKYGCSLKAGKCCERYWKYCK